ncbi:uncharacterized protein LOC141638224 [Silene latifolia]|uniref:uncharacterized protein LOC141638224 n=1 Tax=Silene latifolia TaxID=37657 RepID=UPI003D77B6EF
MAKVNKESGNELDDKLKSLQERFKEELEEQNAQLQQQNKEYQQQMAELRVEMLQFMKHMEKRSRIGDDDDDPASVHLSKSGCKRYFDLCQIPEEQRIDLMSLHMLDKAEIWVNSYLGTVKQIEWETFVTDLYARFPDNHENNVVELFNKLEQTGSLEDYVDKFESLKAFMLQKNKCLTENYFVESFVGGLKPSLKPFVRAFQPVTIAKALELARLQEENLSIKFNKFSSNTKSFTATTKQPPLLPTPSFSKNTYTPQPQTVISPTVSVGSSTEKPLKMPTRKEMDDRKAKGLCMYCGDPYTPGHHLIHKKPTLFWIETDDQEDSQDDFESLDEEEGLSVACISANAITGSTNFQTMRVTGFHNKRPLQILIDSGSTHNFVDEGTATKLGCKIEEITPKAVKVADGKQILVKQICKGFSWKLQNTTFTSDLMVLPLGCCDIVLGVQWLSSLGPIVWDFQKLTMEFHLHGTKHLLRGLAPKKFKSVSGKHMNKLFDQEGQFALLQVCDMPSSYWTEQIECSLLMVAPAIDSTGAMDTILTKYGGLFEEPTTLPPFRPHFDHIIPVKVGSHPVNKRPYRYPVLQKNIIEKMVNELLDKGVIQTSCNPYASPVVLVGKKDGSWRLCVDYRDVNNQTVKDKFPIPLLDDLLDELGGASVFTKLDLRAGYHQLRMHKEDVYKTAFKTHEGHYEFVVMPFGLTNAPASFQSLMNYILKPFLRKFVLVFFDDILIYSKDHDTHLKHVESVFSVLLSNNLFLKKSKCAFAVAKVKYLGHYISTAGVATDPSKVAAVQSWPLPSTLKQLRGFLGLSGYYRRFVKGYGQIVKPLTDLLKKDKLPDFNEEFVIETDASGHGIGAVLMQQGHPLAYISKALSPKNQAKSPMKEN